jgi:hypothetical protein
MAANPRQKIVLNKKPRSDSVTSQNTEDKVNQVWRFDMTGTNPALVLPDDIARLAHAQSEPFVSSGVAQRQGILQLLPMLDNTEETRLQTLERTGILTDLTPPPPPRSA